MNEEMKKCILIRKSLSKHGLYTWELANVLDVSESTVTRMLRKNLSKKEQLEIVKRIEQYARSVKDDGCQQG